MNLMELQRAVSNAIDSAKEHGDNPEEVIVTLQIDDEANPHHGYACTEGDVELTYDGNGIASGCVLHGWRNTANERGESHGK